VSLTVNGVPVKDQSDRVFTITTGKGVSQAKINQLANALEALRKLIDGYR
jgi:hypothetical protein